MIKIIMFIVGVLPFFIADTPLLVTVIGGVIVMTIPFFGSIVGTVAWIYALSVQLNKPFSAWTVVVVILAIFSFLSLWYPELKALLNKISNREREPAYEPAPVKQPPVKEAPKATPEKANVPPPIASRNKPALAVFKDSYLSIYDYLSDTGLCNSEALIGDLGAVLYLIADFCASVNGHLDREALWNTIAREFLYNGRNITENEYLELCKVFQLRVYFYTQLLKGQEPNMFYWLSESRPDMSNPLARITAGFCDVMYDGRLTTPEEYYGHPIAAIKDITETVNFTKSVYIEMVSRLVDYYNEIYTVKAVSGNVNKTGNPAPAKAPAPVKTAEPVRNPENKEVSSFCFKCGTKLAQGSSFCHRCGTPVYKA